MRSTGCNQHKRTLALSPLVIVMTALLSCSDRGPPGAETEGDPTTGTASGALAPSGTGVPSGKQLLGSEAARRSLDALERTFRPVNRPDTPGVPRDPAHPREETRPLMKPTGVESFRVGRGGRLQPVLRAEEVPKGGPQATVELGASAAEGFHLRDERSGLSLHAVLEDARNVPVEEARGIAVYRGASARGGDMFVRVNAGGLEDYVLVSSRPSVEEIVYRVDVSAAAGLRLLANDLELLDSAGTPRLHVVAPYVVDANGAQLAVRLSVEGCAYDTDPRGPWDRPVVPPGASTCTVRIAWGGPDAAYPVVVDPAWSSAGTFSSYERAYHAMSASVPARYWSRADRTRPAI
jgi:hypothetical protein